MTDLGFYEKYVRKLGVDFCEFLERISIIIDESIEFDATLCKLNSKKEFEKPFLFVDTDDKIKFEVLKQLRREQLLRLTKKLL